MLEEKVIRKIKNSSILSWPEWFGRAAQIFDDPRMKIAYYKDGRTGEPYSEEAVHETHQDIFNKLMLQKDHAVLDIGCGVGYFTKFFSHKINKIIGIDVSPDMIQSAYEMNPHGSFFVGNADSLPFKEKIFDRIFTYGVTQYLPDESTIRRMLDEIRRLLKNNGKILVGDILEPIDESQDKSYSKTTASGNRWWPHDLDHNLTKLYLSKNFFLDYCQKYDMRCRFFEQSITDRPIPTPRYDVVMQFNQHE